MFRASPAALSATLRALRSRHEPPLNQIYKFKKSIRRIELFRFRWRMIQQERAPEWRDGLDATRCLL